MRGKFIIVGENIHCTRVVKSGGIRTSKLPEGGEGVRFSYNGEEKLLKVPENWQEISPPYKDGKIKHITLGIYTALNGKTEEERKNGEDYLSWIAERQIEKGADFLDVNVDEYTVYSEKRVEIMKWLVEFLNEKYSIPLSIDSSDVKTLKAGLETCSNDSELMVNSVSMEREEAADLIIRYKAHAVVSAAGKTGLPVSPEEKIANLKEIVSLLDKKGMERNKMHLDPLVLPISVDSANGKNFLDAVTAARELFKGVHITGGLSNVSFGMPNRKLLNLVFTWLFVKAGGDGGIIDPVHLSVEKLKEVNTEAEDFRLARSVLDGSDLYGAEYIAAYRDGRV
ncbi:MAG: dihydropteroate synthase [Spirochaetales bacterium]|nr:dihydropteroate synthase [Spirochaetales bacterium]